MGTVQALYRSSPRAAPGPGYAGRVETGRPLAGGTPAGLTSRAPAPKLAYREGAKARVDGAVLIAAAEAEVAAAAAGVFGLPTRLAWALWVGRKERE